MTHPDGSNRIGHKAARPSRAQAPAILAQSDSGIGGQHDIGNNHHA
jgi:hypothetical protein